MKTGGVSLGFHTLRGRKFPHGNFRTSVFCEVKTQIVGKTKFFDSLNRGARPRLSAFSAKMLLNVHYAEASLPSIWLLRVAMYSSALSASMTLVPQSTKLSTFSPFRCATTVLTA